MATHAEAITIDVADPHFYPLEFDWNEATVVVREMDRASFSRSTFLDHRIAAASGRVLAMPERVYAEEAEALPDAGVPVHFVFHVAFCGSTLVCRVLDMEGKSLTYKEPRILHQLAFGRRATDPGADQAARIDRLLRASNRLLRRTFADTEAAIVKPTDSSANLALDLLRLNPGARALLLYRPLRPFLSSILKAPDRRQYMRGMVSRAQADLQRHGELATVDPAALSDGCVAAYVWTALMYDFISILKVRDHEIRTLDAELLATHPGPVLASITRLFGIPMTDAEVASSVEHGAFRWESKLTTQPFDAESYRVGEEGQRLSLAEEITEAVEWLSDLTRDRPLPRVLPHPLPT